MRVLVTGGAGFIGSHVVDKLITQKHEVIVLDNLSMGRTENLNPQATFYNLDLRSSDLGPAFKTKPEVVIHLAAQLDINRSIHDPRTDAEINIIGTINLLESCRKNKVKKIIFAGSAAEIGEPSSLPILETHPAHPLSPYGVSKHCVEHYLKVYSRLYGLKYTYLRYANVYGPRQGLVGEGGVISVLVRKLVQNEPITIFGDGKQTRDFIYVEDVANATILMLEKGDNQIYNIGTGIETSINELLTLLSTITSKEINPLHLKPREGDIQRSVFSIDKIKQDLVWQPKTSLKEGLLKTIRYFQSQQK